MTGTDHHLFWVDNKGAWVELEDVQPGDTLLTPNGVTTIDTLTVFPANNTEVWELDTTGPDTFTVHTGTTDVLVHNCNAEGEIQGWDDLDPQGRSRREHVEAHGRDNPERPGKHGVFDGDPVESVESAWELAVEEGIEGVQQPNGNIRYEVPFEGAGIQSGNPDLPGHGDILDTITVVVKPPDNTIVTGFPSP